MGDLTADPSVDLFWKADAENRLIFERLFAPLVLDARAGLRRRVSDRLDASLGMEALAGWDRYLLRRLTSVATKAVDHQFQVFKTVRQIFPRGETEEGLLSHSLYEEFIGCATESRLGKLFEEFPALAEYCTVLVGHWTATIIEFLDRLEADRDSLNCRFNKKHFTCRVVNLEAGLSDPHHGGRGVLRLVFESGSRLIYKPRSIAPEACFYDLLERLNATSIAYPLRTARCWDRDGYGWTEDVMARPCRSLAEVQAFYWRAGVLLGAVYLARGVDMHCENLIAAGEFPVLIDLEALWHPQESAGTDRSVWHDSVLRTGFLPQPNQGIDEAYRSSSLCRRPDCATTPPVRKDEDFESMKRVQELRHHLPTCGGKMYPASDFIPSIQTGFRWVGEQLLGSTSSRAGFECWLQALVRCPRRRIYRSSSHYHAILRRMTSPQRLRKSHRPANSVPAVLRESWPPLNADEIRALQQLDIPRLRQNNATAEPHRPLLDADAAARFFSQVPLIAQTLTEPMD